MMKRRAWTLSVLAVAAWLFSAPVRADVVIGNFGAALGVGTNFGPGTSTMFKAAGFTMGNRDYVLDGVTLTMDFAGGGEATVEIWTGASAPQSLALALDSPPQTGAGDFTFTPPTEFRLLRGQSYWVYVRAASGAPGNFLWQGTSPPRIPAGPARHIAYIFNNNPSNTYNRYQVEGTLVPICHGDCNRDRILDIFDIVCFQDAFLRRDPLADCTGDGRFDVFDFLCFQDSFLSGCP